MTNSKRDLAGYINAAMIDEVDAHGGLLPHGRDAGAWARGFSRYCDDLPEGATVETMTPIIAAWLQEHPEVQ